jgi:hypothetical protein
MCAEIPGAEQMIHGTTASAASTAAGPPAAAAAAAAALAGTCTAQAAASHCTQELLSRLALQIGSRLATGTWIHGCIQRCRAAVMRNDSNSSNIASTGEISLS